jgi:uncharacterized protein (DUF1810 family)
MEAADPFDLGRFVAAQAPVFDTALAELRAGRKRSHWMWFVFPQARGLGHSTMAQVYAIGSLEEARAYLAHPVLGPRLEACTLAALASGAESAHAIFGAPDDMKFRSSMTLFAVASGSEVSVFRAALERYFAGRADERTVAFLRESGSP